MKGPGNSFQSLKNSKKGDGNIGAKKKKKIEKK